MIKYGTAQTDEDLLQILELQKENHRSLISDDEFKKEGFVTVKHDFALLKRMNQPHPHIVARSHDQVIAYALVMLPEIFNDIPALATMVDLLDNCSWKNQPLTNFRYFVMGQICIKKGFRGMGVLPGLYREMNSRMHPFYDAVITEISHLNQRSLRAHQKAGFELLHTHQASDGEYWDIVIRGF